MSKNDFWDVMTDAERQRFARRKRMIDLWNEGRSAADIIDIFSKEFSYNIGDAAIRSQIASLRRGGVYIPRRVKGWNMLDEREREKNIKAQNKARAIRRWQYNEQSNTSK